MKHNLGTLLGVVGVTTATTLLGVAEAQAILLIDDWSVDHSVGEGNAETVGSSSDDSLSGGTIFGGFRGVDMTGAEGPDSITTAGTVLGNVGESLEFVTGSQTNDRMLRLVYAGNQGGSNSVGDPANSSISATDFLSEGSGILFNRVSGNFKLGVTLYNDGSGSATATQDISRTNRQPVFFDFDTDFSYSLSSGKTQNDLLSNVGGFEFKITELEDGGTNPVIGNVQVGEPVPFNAESWIGLALLGTWGSWKYLKKRNQPKLQLTASDEN